MRIALCGTDAERVEEHKMRLTEGLSAMNQIVESVDYVEEDMLHRTGTGYDIAFFEENAVGQFEEYVKAAANRRKLTLKAGTQIWSFYIDDIYYVEAQLNKIHVVTRVADILLPIGITEVESLLTNEPFIRVHRSYLVNMQHIDRISNRVVYMEKGKEIAISKYRLREVKKKLLEYEVG